MASNKLQSACSHLGFVLPAIAIKDIKNLRRDIQRHAPRKGRRSVDERDTASEIAGDILKGVIPWIGPHINSRDIRRLSRLLEATINETTSILENITVELQAVRLVSLQNRMVLDMMLAESGGVCKIIGASCCTYVPDSSDTVREAKKKCIIQVQKHTWILAHGI